LVEVDRPTGTIDGCDGGSLWMRHVTGRAAGRGSWAGVRAAYDDVVIDPVLPRRADGVCMDLEREGRRIRFRYEVRGAGFGPGEVRVNGRTLQARRATDPYRTGGLLIARAAFRAALDRAENVVDAVV
jgi:cellobiose phosphorylase